MRIVVRDIDPEDFYAAITPVLAKHHTEAEGSDSLPLNVDYELGEQLYSLGMLMILGAFDISNGADKAELLGYSVDILQPAFHYKGTTFATTDSLWVSPDARGLGVFETLNRRAEAKLRELGVYSRHLVLKSKEHPSVDGYSLQEQTYVKRLN
jgi:ribosomal protein S18 acetylase RimI-like enzyme